MVLKIIGPGKRIIGKLGAVSTSFLLIWAGVAWGAPITFKKKTVRFGIIPKGCSWDNWGY